MIGLTEYAVLLVEDNPADRLLVGRVLKEGQGLAPHLVQAGCLTEALALLEREEIDLIVLDLGLPDCQGLETLGRLRAVAPEVPVMVLSGMDDPELALEALRAGASDYLVKGEEDGRSLRRSIRMALERAELTRELERHHQRLRDGDARLKALFQTAQDAIISAEGRGTMLFWNRGAEAIFGYAAEEALGEPLSLILPEGFREVLETSLETAQGGSGSPAAPRHDIREYSGRRKDGSRVPVELSVSSWLEEGQPRFTAILRDVGDRNAARHAIEQLSRQHELLLASAGQGIVGVDPEGVVTFANPAALEMTGLDVADLVGESAHDKIHCPDGDGNAAPQEDCLLARCLGEGVPLRGERTFCRKDGSSFPVISNYRPILEGDGVVGAVLVFDDISEQKALAEQLRHSQKMEVVGSLAGGIAHDFNNELSVIILNAGLMSADLADGRPPDEEHLAEIQAAATRATRITGQLLNFSRRAPLELRRSDLREIARHLVGMLEKLLPENIELRLRCAEHPCVAEVDRSVVEQAVLNLATNARDAMPRGGRLEIVVDRAPSDANRLSGDFCRLTVRDTGAGMDDKVLESALIPFFTTKPKGKGTGLGLSMVYGLTEQLGGFLDIDSTPGVGTAVRLGFPAVEQAGRAEEGGMKVAAGGVGGGTVLLVEDEVALRQVCSKVLNRCGYDVISAAEGGEALRLYSEHEGDIDIVLSDVSMRGVDGPMLREELFRRYGAVPFVFTTGHSGSDEVALEGLPVLIKPWTVEDLVETLGREMTRIAPLTREG